MALFERVLDPSGHFKRLNVDMNVLRAAVGPVPECINFMCPDFKAQIEKHCDVIANSLWQFDYVTQSLYYNGKILYPYAAVISEQQVLYVYDKNLIAIVAAFKQPESKKVYSVHFPTI